MEEERDKQEILCEQMDTINESLLFLILIILSILLSFWSVLLQRGQLASAIAGEEAENTPPIFPIKCAAGGIVIGALGYFLSLALKSAGEAAQGEDCVAQTSASSNVWASILVLAAALIRFCDLHFVERCQQVLIEEDLLPD